MVQCPQSLPKRLREQGSFSALRCQKCSVDFFYDFWNKDERENAVAMDESHTMRKNIGVDMIIYKGADPSIFIKSYYFFIFC